jgi:metallo-beta-lactamase family protein
MIETADAKVLVDCGMFQGSKTEKELNYRAFPFLPSAIAALLLTHAHIDHSGLIPKLVKDGFAGPIWATPATIDLASVMLPDSGHVQEIEVEHLNRRNSKRGGAPVEPIYTAVEAVACIDRFRPIGYRTWLDVAKGIRARFWNAGHLLGSASIEVEIERGGELPPLRLLFSGDVGPDNKLLQPGPEAPAGFDYILCESTYGDEDRIEKSEDARRRILRDEVRAAFRPGGVLLIPSFAVERTQELLVDLVRLMSSGDVPKATIYVDSPLATKASAVFARHVADLDNGPDLAAALQSPLVRFTESVEQSKALDRLRDFHIVIAGSGMCDAGRIRFRLKNWLWREEATVLLVGFQAQGTLGRILLDGVGAVRIQGEDITVRARIRSLDLYSGHADAAELAAWVKARLPLRGNLFLVHGERQAQQGFQARLAPIVGPGRVLVPAIDQTYALAAEGARLVETGVAPRVEPRAVAQLDWHNDLSELVLDINDAVRAAADENRRAAIIRRLRRALADGPDDRMPRPGRGH